MEKSAEVSYMEKIEKEFKSDILAVFDYNSCSRLEYLTVDSGGYVEVHYFCEDNTLNCKTDSRGVYWSDGLTGWSLCTVVGMVMVQDIKNLDHTKLKLALNYE